MTGGARVLCPSWFITHNHHSRVARSPRHSPLQSPGQARGAAGGAAGGSPLALLGGGRRRGCAGDGEAMTGSPCPCRVLCILCIPQDPCATKRSPHPAQLMLSPCSPQLQNAASLGSQAWGPSSNLTLSGASPPCPHPPNIRVSSGWGQTRSGLLLLGGLGGFCCRRMYSTGDTEGGFVVGDRKDVPFIPCCRPAALVAPHPQPSTIQSS